MAGAHRAKCKDEKEERKVRTRMFKVRVKARERRINETRGKKKQTKKGKYTLLSAVDTYIVQMLHFQRLRES